MVVSDSVFDFMLQPNITISGFPSGTYEVQADGFDFDRQTLDNCENGVMCSQLAAMFRMSSTPEHAEPGSFEVVYTPYDGTRRTTRIRINYGELIPLPFLTHMITPLFNLQLPLVFTLFLLVLYCDLCPTGAHSMAMQ